MPRETGTRPTSGDDKIVRMGHTASKNQGSDPNMRGKGQDKPRDLKIK